jgi:hypothetical protein
MRFVIPFLRAVALVTAVVAQPHDAAAIIPVTTCGQELNGDGMLTGALDCTGFDHEAVVVHRGTLRLNGFTIGGGAGVLCEGPCAVIGPGRVTGSSSTGINASGTSLRVEAVDVADNALYGIQCAGSCKIVGPLTISGNAGGIRAGARLVVRDVAITGNDDAAAVYAANDAGTSSATITHATVTANWAGIVAQRKVTVRDSIVTGNAIAGVSAGVYRCASRATATITNSIVTGNDTAAICGKEEACFDVGTCLVPPRLKASSCNHSHVNGSDDIGRGDFGDDWDVCAFD